ncbi:MarC family NAAT transporter [Flammeovirga pacifica]|uniref:UPF0056 membrane protein n=1 Tax=Flammeovirga pacifica TaxID=915059 RepID=A0A1S1Z2Z6_FLAPC|nr:MarC family NAAT transporter [Flammeovirga pacifica]OHX67455.1 hypothetical protein NH26_14430 [Flammeovirga pacifica]
MIGIIEIALITFLALLPISNPFSSVPLFLSLTKGHTREWSNKQALMASIFMAGILLTFLWSGAIIIEFFGISIPAIRVAGGLIIMKVGFGMLNPKETEELSDEIKEESKTKSDISFTPLAMPSLAGPGSISVVISMAAGSDNLPGYIAISLGVLMVVLVAYLSMRGAPFISKILGVTGLDALTRIMGFILICVAFQFVLDGIGGYIESKDFLEPIIKMIKSITTS